MNNEIIRITDKGSFDPSKPIGVTFLLKDYLLDKKPYKIKFYKGDSNGLVDLEISFEECWCNYKNLEEVIKNDFSQFERIHIKQL